MKMPSNCNPRTASRFRSLFVSLALLLIALTPGLAATEGFKLVSLPLHIPERGEVTSYAIMTESHRFSFLPPPNWKVKSDSKGQEVTLTPPDLMASIQFKITRPGPDLGEESQSSLLRTQIQTRYPGAVIIREFNCYTGGSQGLAFDLERVVQKKSKIAMRLAFVPFAGGRVEFNLTASAQKFEDYHRAFGNLLTSFRIDPSVTRE